MLVYRVTYRETLGWYRYKYISNIVLLVRRINNIYNIKKTAI